MIANLGARLNRLAERFMPDPFVLVLLLTMATVAIALVMGDAKGFADQSVTGRLGMLADGWYADLTSKGLMKFALQMCLVLITGHALALSAPVQAMIRALTSRVKTAGAAVVVVSLVGGLASLIQWGLGVIVGAFMAREMGRAFARDGRPVHYPLLGAAGYAGFMVWHGGLSGSAPLKVAEPGHFLAESVGVIPVDQTLFGGLNLVVTSTLLVVIAFVLWRMMPTDEAEMVPFALGEDEDVAPEDVRASSTLLHVLEHTRLLNVLVSLFLLGWLVRFFGVRGVQGWNLDSINVIGLALGLGLHRSPRSYVDAVMNGARGCAGIIVQFPLYFGILGMLKVSGLIAQIAAWFVAISTPTTFPVWTFLSAGFVNFLVPSGGGQWAVQGPVVMAAVKELGVEPARAIMALAYGDAWTNMLQPFWALPLLGIMGLRARDILGYTTLVLLATGPVIVLGLLLL